SKVHRVAAADRARARQHDPAADHRVDVETGERSSFEEQRAGENAAAGKVDTGVVHRDRAAGDAAAVDQQQPAPRSPAADLRVGDKAAAENGDKTGDAGHHVERRTAARNALMRKVAADKSAVRKERAADDERRDGRAAAADKDESIAQRRASN